MEKYKYIVNYIGWTVFLITLFILITLNKCDKNNLPTETKQYHTVINNYYDTSKNQAPQIRIIDGKAIPMLIPAIVDTQKILANYFAKNPYTRTFGDSCIKVELTDSISQNKFLSPGKFSYQWLKPIKTVLCTTVTTTVESKKQFNILAGANASFQKNFVFSYGINGFLLTKNKHLFGLGYDLKNDAIQMNLAININEAIRDKNK